ncbi:MAG: hypothetical protein K2Y51_00865 [Gammaproteobacteria bacterium]|nr:hypothetical protein [Gammaproteobacteria bacterium]
MKVLALPALWLFAPFVLGFDETLSVDAVAAPAASGAASVIELQAHRQRTVGRVDGRERAALTDLNPLQHGWYLLERMAADGSVRRYHLQLPAPARQRLALDAADGSRLRISGPTGERLCELDADDALASAAARALPYVPLCDHQLYLRRRLRGAETRLENVTQFLRDRVWGGEALVDVVKSHLTDAEREEGVMHAARAVPSSPLEGPHPARVAAEYAEAALDTGRLGISVDAPEGLVTGRWYPARAQRDVFVSAMLPAAVAPEILARHHGSVNTLDTVERAALVYLVAFDLAQFEVGFALGTEHPRVEWSPRAAAARADSPWPGPDGFASLAPLAMTGMVPPWHTADTIATFIGGFKREHGAFKYGAFAQARNGNHYGFVEQGVVLSSLKPGLATLYVLMDGSVRLGTWRERDDVKLQLVRHARQNGVPLVERDRETGESAPGLLVNRWGPGNWSGSSESSLRALRSGLCLATHGERRWLVYAYFSTATPSAMARVFQAYDCDYAMLLDMNALVHTYLALYALDDQALTVEHVVREMREADPSVDGKPVPRFLAAPDNRDFFYLTRRRAAHAP